MRRAAFMLIAALLALLAVAAPAYAEDGWASLSSDPEAGAELAAGQEVPFTLTLNAPVQDETLIRLRFSGGLALDEESVALFRASTDETEQPEAAWGNDGCVLIAFGLQAGDSVSFSAKVDDDAPGNEPSAQLEVICGEEVLTASFAIEAPESAATPSPTPAPAPTETPAAPAESPGRVYMPRYVLILIGAFIVLGLVSVLLIRRIRGARDGGE